LLLLPGTPEVSGAFVAVTQGRVPGPNIERAAPSGCSVMKVRERSITISAVQPLPAGEASRRRGRPPNAEARDTRAALLEAALDLFARHGYAGTSIRAIARTVGLSESVIYKHFAKKQEIFDEVLYQAGTGLLIDQLAVIDPRLLAADDPAAFLRAMGEQLLAAWDEPRARRLTSVLARAVGDTHAQAIAAAGQVQQEIARVFAGWMEAGRIPAGRGTPTQLAWELFAGSAFVRLLYLHAEASPEIRRAGHQLIRTHIEFVIATVFTDAG
jgi:AcrR family transcriptional regulator